MFKKVPKVEGLRYISSDLGRESVYSNEMHSSSLLFEDIVQGGTVILILNMLQKLKLGIFSHNSPHKITLTVHILNSTVLSAVLSLLSSHPLGFLTN